MENGKIDVSDIEIKENKKLYAIDAFKMIEEQNLENDIFFLMGADNFVKMNKWKDYDKLIKYKYIIFEREDIDLQEEIERAKFPRENILKIIKNIEHKKSSSTEYRENANKKILPKEVLQYIEKNGIYKE